MFERDPALYELEDDHNDLVRELAEEDSVIEEGQVDPVDVNSLGETLGRAAVVRDADAVRNHW
jgi:hypothetical protein